MLVASLLFLLALNEPHQFSRLDLWERKCQAGDEQACAQFEEAQAAVAPIYDVEDILNDPQFQALDSITTVDDPDLGPLRMQNVMFRMSETPGEIRFPGRERGVDNEEVFGELGVGPERLEELRDEGVV